MRVILVMVVTIDGKITKWDSEAVWQWASKEDQTYFKKFITKHNLIVMGRKTFEAVAPKPEKGKLRIIMTQNPSVYASIAVAGQLEFTDEEPKELIARLEGQGFTQMLLVGGAVVNTQFLEEGLVDELWLTIEPRIFGSGKTLTLPVNLDISLKLMKSEKLNKQGTLLLKYLIIDKERPIR